MIDLSPDQLKAVRRILAEQAPGCEVRAFGSRVTWTAKEFSDLDLAVVGTAALEWETLARLREAFEESNLPIQVDVLDWHGISESFREVIGEDYEVIQRGATESTTLKRNWRNMTLGEVCAKIGSGATPRGGKKTYLRAGPYSLIRSQNVYNDGFHRDGLAFISKEQADDLRNVEVLEEDVLLNITGDSVARVCQVDPEMLPARVNQHVAIIRPEPDQLDAGYLRYYLSSPGVQTLLLSWADSGSTRKALTKQMIEAFEVWAPADIAEQRAIAHILGTLDDKIELNRRMNETLEEMARALFKCWFVDFGPVRAKMEGRWRRGASLPGMPAELYNVFSDDMVDSDLGEIPAGWEVRRLKDFATVVYGAPFSSKRFNDSRVGLPLIRIRDLATHNPGVFTDERLPKGHLILPADIVVGMDGEFSAHIWKGPQAWLNQRVCHFEPLPGIPKLFLLEALSKPLADLEREIVGTTVIHLGKRHIDSIELIGPSTDLLDAFARITDDICQEVVANALQSLTLSALRDTLLPKLMSGEAQATQRRKRQHD